MRNYFLLLTLFIGFSILYGCKVDKPDEIEDDFSVSIRISSDPSRMNPMLTNTAEAREVNVYVFLQMAEFDPITLQLSPILAKTLPIPVEENQGQYVGYKRFDYEIVPEAVWDDGSPITAEDYIFTLKVVKLPIISAASWRAGLSPIRDVIVDKNNPKKFSVYIEKGYNFGLEASASFEIYPRHIYDPEDRLAGLKLSDFVDQDAMALKVEKDTSLISFAKTFESAKYSSEIVQGAGPYKLGDWQSDQYIKLERKENYWGKAYPDRTFLQAWPKEIVFHIIPDENTAATQLKSGNIDFMQFREATIFSNVKESESGQQSLEFYTPQTTQYYYIGMNNQSPLLRENIVRRALAHLMDVDRAIEQLENQDAEKIVSLLPPTHPDYRKDLSPIPLDIPAAAALLKEGGWRDSNGNDILDKMIDGKLRELNLRFFVGTDLGSNLALYLKENASKVGIDIEIIKKPFRQQLPDNIFPGDFELFVAANTMSLGKYDPSGRWRSEEANGRGGNYNKYINPKVDSLLDSIIYSTSASKISGYYEELQEIIYNDQPAIFLYSPLSRIAVNKRLKPLISVKRPGYFANASTLQKSAVPSLN